MYLHLVAYSGCLLVACNSLHPLWITKPLAFQSLEAARHYLRFLQRFWYRLQLTVD